MKFVSTATPDGGFAVHVTVSVVTNASVVTSIEELCTPLPFTVNPEIETW